MTDTVSYVVWIETMPGWDDITGCNQKKSKHIIIPVLQSEAKTSAARARYLSHTESPLKFPSTSINTFRSEWSPLKRIWLAWKMGKQKKVEKVIIAFQQPQIEEHKMTATDIEITQTIQMRLEH